MTGLRAITVAVDYSDLLAVTLPYNRHHFDQVHIVTDQRSALAVQNVTDPTDGNVFVWVTDLFTAGGAVFNKWAALEWGLDRMGREGFIAIMDADVLWPRAVHVAPFGQSLRFGLADGRGDLVLNRGELMTPLRRMAPWPLGSLPFIQNPDEVARNVREGFVGVPAESSWHRFPIHRNVAEWAGYSQCFHASDPALGPPPWHEVTWTHCGGADSIFQRKWPPHLKRRPPWEVLHLGPAGENWMGRATPYADGTVPADAAEKGAMVRGIWEGRRRLRTAGASEAEQFRPEKLG